MTAPDDFDFDPIGDDFDTTDDFFLDDEEKNISG